MLSKLIGGRSIFGVATAVIIAIPAMYFLPMWFLPSSSPPDHWLAGSLTNEIIFSMILSIVVVIVTAFVTRFEISKGQLSESRGSHHLLLIPLLACHAYHIESFIQVTAACIAAVSFLMLISTSPQGKKRDPIFHVGIVLATSIILAPTLWVLIILSGLVMIRVGRYQWRNWAALVLGLLFPCVVLYTAALIGNFHDGLVTSFFSQFQSVQFIGFAWKYLVIPLVVLVLSIAGLMASFSPLTVTGKVLLQCHSIWLFGSMILLALGIVDSGTLMISIAIPASVFIARWMEYVNRKWIVDLTYLGLIISLLI